MGGGADGIESARRVNAAADLVAADLPAGVAARVLAGRYAVSVRQARRDGEQALVVGRVDVPEPNVVFTVKLPGSLVGQERARPRAREATVSWVGARAVADFLRG